MATNSKIEWCHHTANTWWGCTKVSAGCANCYAEAQSKRYGFDVWGNGASRRMMKGVWDEVYKWAKAAASAGERHRVFWGSMMDVCEDRPELAEPRKRMCGIIEELEDLDFLILSKRPENYTRLMPWGTGRWPRNAWALTSAENQEMYDKRVEHLLSVDAVVHGISAEPLLGNIDLGEWLTPRDGCGGADARLDCEFCVDAARCVNWVIAGGESGPKSRPCDVQWIRNIVSQCKDAGVSCFVKQLGASVFDSSLSDIWFDGRLRNRGVADDGPKAAYARGCMGAELQPATVGLKDKKGGDWDEWPADLRVREFPAVSPKPEEAK